MAVLVWARFCCLGVVAILPLCWLILQITHALRGDGHYNNTSSTSKEAGSKDPGTETTETSLTIRLVFGQPAESLWPLDYAVATAADAGLWLWGLGSDKELPINEE